MREPLLRSVLAGVLLILAISAACGDRGDETGPSGRPGQPVPDEIVIPGQAIDALKRYAFTSELDVTSARGDLQLRFEGRLEAPDRLQGTLRRSGQLADDVALDPALRPHEMEVIVIGENAWWREPGGDWRPGISPGYERIDPLTVFRDYATPRFYLEALRFDSLALPVGGPLETVNGVRAYPVRLDKATLVELLPRGTALKRYPWEEPEPMHPGFVENTQQVLPRDFLVTAWFAEEGSYPVRIVIDYSISLEEYGLLAFNFQTPMTLRLQLDLTDPDADVHIEEPAQIASEPQQ